MSRPLSSTCVLCCSFDTFAHPEKDDLLSLVDSFTNKTGVCTVDLTASGLWHLMGWATAAAAAESITPTIHVLAGKFGIKGFPHKLGFLLHGPPGTGKTSFIKALASHTGRSILAIPLSKVRVYNALLSLRFPYCLPVRAPSYGQRPCTISWQCPQVRTNSQLMDMLMDQHVVVAGEDMPIYLPFEKVGVQLD